MTNESRGNRERGIRQVSYHRHRDGIPGLTSPRPLGPVTSNEVGIDIDLDELISSFEFGVKRFIGDIEENESLRSLVHDRIAKSYLRRLDWIL